MIKSGLEAVFNGLIMCKCGHQRRQHKRNYGTALDAKYDPKRGYCLIVDCGCQRFKEKEEDDN